MEKPTGVIQKIIESLQQVNTLDIFSPIEKDIILHNLRAAYMIFLNIPVEEHRDDNRVEKLFFEENEQKKEETKQDIQEEVVNEEIIVDEPSVEEPVVEESIVDEPFVEETTVEEPIVEESFVEETPVETLSVEPALQDDLLEFIPDAKPQTTSLFDETTIPKPETKSLNELLTEKKDELTLGVRFQQSYIPDLTKAIAINEKFTFIRELFRNSGVDFSNAIQKLNECENIDTAFVFMEELKHQYLWDTTSSAYLTLCDMVRRRFLT